MPSTRHIKWFLFTFTSLCLAAFVVLLISDFTDQSWAKKSVKLGQEMGRLIFTATGVTFVIVEGGAMLSELFKKASRAEGRVEGRDLERAIWMDWREKHKVWLERKDAASREGRSFTEPEPAPPDS